MNDSAAQARVLLALSGLVPIAWLEARERAARLGLPFRREQLMPTDEEREELLGKLCMADDLALGFANGPRRAGSLAALTKAIVALAACPGGVRIFGRRWEVVDLIEEGGLAPRESEA